MQVTIKNLFPRDVVLLRTTWMRIKGAEAVNEKDFEYLPEPHDFVEVQVSNCKTQETQ